jgi:hypothetical protein
LTLALANNIASIVAGTAERNNLDFRFKCADGSRVWFAGEAAALIGLANALGIDIVAEGVSTPEQRDFLISAGCKLAQGYYFGRPMPASDVRTLLVKPKEI